MDDLIIYYESADDGASVSVTDTCAIHRNEDGSYSIQDINSFVPSTMTVCCQFSDGTSISDLDSLYYCLSCLYSYQRFNIDDGFVITSVRWRGMTKGDSGGYFRSNVIITIYLGIKRFSVKISQRSLHITGARSRDEISGIINFVIEQIDDAQQFYDFCIDNTKLLISVAEWLSMYSRGRPVTRNITIDIGSTDFITESVTYHCIVWPAQVPEEYYEVALEIRNRFVDLKYSEHILQRAVQISKSPSIYLGEGPVLTEFSISMVNFNFQLGIEIDRRVLADELAALGYNAAYHNVGSDKLIITVVDENKYDDDRFTRKKSENLFETLFKITKKGKILCTGCGERQERAYIKLMSDIVRVCSKEI